jgi:hypothetical protein
MNLYDKYLDSFVGTALIQMKSNDAAGPNLGSARGSGRPGTADGIATRTNVPAAPSQSVQPQPANRAPPPYATGEPYHY